MVLQERVKAIVGPLGPKLISAGFRKRGRVFAQAEGNVRGVIDVQLSRWNDTKGVQFTMNCGVYVPGVLSIFRKTSDPRSPTLTHCCVSARVGMLTESHLDLWWKVTPAGGELEDAATRDEVLGIVDDVILPFLRIFPDERAVAEYLSNPPRENHRYVDPRAPALRYAYAALLWRNLGRGGESTQRLKQAVDAARNTPLEETVAAFAKKFPRSARSSEPVTLDPKRGNE